LMDLQMPVMGGYAATLEMKKMPELRNVPVVAMTADAMEGVREKCIEVGMVDFISKPINPSKMLEVLQKWLKSPGSPKPRSKGDEDKLRFPKLKNVNTKDGLGRLNGNTRLYQDLLVAFHEDHRDFIDSVIKEFTLGDPSTARRQIHTLKGTSASLGMNGIHRAVIGVEAKLEGPFKNEALHEIMARLRHEMHTVITSLAKSLVRTQTARKSISMEVAKPMLSDLHHLLQQQDLKALGVVDGIGDIAGHEKLFDKVRIAAKAYDFDGARELLLAMDIKLGE
jgi:two-component system sensor histidine kinase/response regulator